MEYLIEIISVLNERKQSLERLLYTYSPNDFAEYSYICGKLNGIETSISETKNLISKLGDEDFDEQ